MSGTFSKDNRPLRPGAYFAFEAIQATPPPPGLAGIVAIPFTSDWGPSEVPTLLRSFAEFKAVFGDSTNTMGYRSVRQAFQGEGLPGFGGAGAVLAYRMSGSAAAKASHALTNTTPVTAITLTAIYEGSFGNNLNVTIQDNAADSTKDQLLIYRGSTLLETYTYVDANVADLVAQINANSNWVTATQSVTGVSLTHVTAASLTAGNDGSTLVAGDWTAMMSGIETQRFAVMGAEFPTDSPTLTALKTWVDAKRAAGKMFRVVVGGALNENSATAIARAQSFNDEAFLVIGQGSVQDANLGVLSTTMLAPRIAGAAAARGESRSLTYSRYTDLTILVGATDSEILAGFAAGLMVLSQDSNLDAPVRIEKGLTTYTITTNPDKPYLIYRDPKFIATMDAIQMELTEFAEQNVVGKLTVNGSTRSFVRAAISTTMRNREAAGIVQPGWTVDDDLDPPPTPQDDFMQFVIGMTFGRSAEQVYFTASVG